MKRNNLIKKLLRCMAAAGCTLLAACSADSDPAIAPQPGEQVEVSFRLSTRAGKTIPTEDQPEYQIQSVRIYAFKGTELVGYHYTDNIADAMPTATITEKMTLPTGSIDFYTIVNEVKAGTLKLNNGTDAYTLPDATNIETATVTPADLKSITFSTLPTATPAAGNDETTKDETNKTYTRPVLPMATKQTVSISSSTKTVDLTMTRSVAKLNLRFAKIEPTTEKYNVYMGRGMFLYNVPQYGYLFAKETTYADTDFYHLEDGDDHPDITDPSQDEDTKYSHLHQRNGMMILQSGWPEEGADDAGTDNENFKETHINEITTVYDESKKEDITAYQVLPNKPIYLFANPNKATNPANPMDDKAKGYYLKMLIHEHQASDTDQKDHYGEQHYVCLPAIEANRSVTLCSRFTAEFENLMPHWLIVEWEEKKIDIDFN